MRDIIKVITEMINKIPSTEIEFLSQLNNLIDSCKYTAPEMIGLRWEQLTEIVNEYIVVEPESLNEWQRNVISIFVNKSIENIK